MSAVRTFFGVFFIILFLVIMGSVTGGLIYLYYNPQTTGYQDLDGGQCVAGGSTCYRLGNYSIYPVSNIPESDTIAFDATTVYGEDTMNGTRCMQKCSKVDGCKSAVCIFDESGTCTCTGYTTVLEAQQCTNAEKCASIYVKN